MLSFRNRPSLHRACAIPEKIASAVRDALAVTLPAGSPLAQFALYLDQLKAKGGFNDDELFEVDTRVRQFLTMLADKDSGA